MDGSHDTVLQRLGDLRVLPGSILISISLIEGEDASRHETVESSFTDTNKSNFLEEAKKKRSQ